MKRYLSSLALLLLFPAWLMAQTYRVSGTVVDSRDGSALPGANIYLSELSRGQATNLEGRFSIENIPEGSYTLTVRFVGYQKYVEVLEVDQNVQLSIAMNPSTIGVEAIHVVADRAKVRETPVAFSNISKEQLEQRLGSRDIPLALNTTPSVYATAQGGGAGDARINVRGFAQDNFAVMINGVPVNDMENGWVYWSNWDGLGDATSSIQLQRGLGASNLAAPSVGGTMNIVTDAAQQSTGGSFKQEVGSGGFFKSTLSVHTGELNEKFAASFVGVRKVGNGVVDKTWTDAWSYFLALSYRVNANHRVQGFLVGAPQKHGQRLYSQPIATWDADYAQELGIDVTGSSENGLEYNPNWGPVNAPADALQEYYWGKVRDVRDTDYLMERENYYHKPQANINWYWSPNDRVFVSNVFYGSLGRGGGSGSYGDWPGYNADGQFDFQNAYDMNTATTATGNNRLAEINAGYVDGQELEAQSILRNSVNLHNWFGWIGTVDYQVNEQFELTTGIDARSYKGEHYREVRNLIGGDYFYDTSNNNRETAIKRLGDKVNYHNDGFVRWIGGFAQLQGKFLDEQLTTNVTFNYSVTGYQRKDYFLAMQDGEFQTTAWETFPGYKLLLGANYNLTDALNIYGNVGSISKAPGFDNVFYYDNSLIEPSVNENIVTFEIGTGYRTGIFAANLNYYNTLRENRAFQGSINTANESYLFLLKGVDARHKGVELDFTLQPVTFLQVNGAVAIADWKWLNDVETTYAPEEEPTAQQDFVAYIDGLNVGDAAQTQLSGSVKVTPMRGLFADITVKHFADYYSSFDPVDRDDPADRSQPWKIPAYTLLDLHAGYTIPVALSGISGIETRVSLFNLLDEVYISDSTDGFQHDASTANVYMGLPRRINFSVKISI